MKLSAENMNMRRSCTVCRRVMYLIDFMYFALRSFSWRSSVLSCALSIFMLLSSVFISLSICRMFFSCLSISLFITRRFCRRFCTSALLVRRAFSCCLMFFCSCERFDCRPFMEELLYVAVFFVDEVFFLLCVVRFEVVFFFVAVVVVFLV